MLCVIFSKNYIYWPTYLVTLGVFLRFPCKHKCWLCWVNHLFNKKIIYKQFNKLFNIYVFIKCFDINCVLRNQQLCMWFVFFCYCAESNKISFSICSFSYSIHTNYNCILHNYYFLNYIYIISIYIFMLLLLLCKINNLIIQSKFL